ncbi:hypothetical protein L211DRAFT_144057 [Terfezia boudieri ATCC MYA-4762]|uniref:Uncharacterized protein n=1 Tax=Terfezia boudieri ATCC MYA-4762 TaxID=1051890 RepID=A0A3N4M334_9PEZI|nr:hypothetical protein L211DRAFT_144057 [Terfezia boudieri ATCC MYA-4762]
MEGDWCTYHNEPPPQTASIISVFHTLDNRAIVLPLPSTRILPPTSRTTPLVLRPSASGIRMGSLKEPCGTRAAGKPLPHSAYIPVLQPQQPVKSPDASCQITHPTRPSSTPAKSDADGSDALARLANELSPEEFPHSAIYRSVCVARRAHRPPPPPAPAFLSVTSKTFPPDCNRRVRLRLEKPSGTSSCMEQRFELGGGKKRNC